MGNVSSGGGTSNNLGTAPEEKYTGFYIQDDVKLTRTLTVNLECAGSSRPPGPSGTIAWHTSTMGAKIQSVAEQPARRSMSAAITLAIQNATNFKKLAPRIGFTEQILHNLVVRGGYGIFYPPAQFTGTMASPVTASPHRLAAWTTMASQWVRV